MEARNPLCTQCNTFHPPIPEGSSCPMAPVKDEKTGEEIDLNQILSPLTTILKAQIDSKDIKNFESFCKYMIVEITKAAESYKE